MGNLGYLAAGFAVVWAALAAYLFRIWIAQRRLHARVADLERRTPTSGLG